MHLSKIFGAGIIFCCVFTTSLMLGMAQAPQKNIALEDQAMKSLVEEALSNIEYAYESRNLSMMMDSLDKDFSGALEFQSSLQDYFFLYRNLQVHFALDTFLVESNNVSVRLHWFKKSMDTSGTFAKLEGSSQFVFTKAATGLKLLYIRGENPFY